MGKLDYALTLYGKDAGILDLSVTFSANFPDSADPESLEKMLKNIFVARIVTNLQDGILSMLERGIDAQRFFRENLPRLADKVLIGDEIGSGIVPQDPFERKWRDETGRVYRLIADRADIVDRVWAGLPLRLKG